jgi:hypothetical protein
MDVGKISRELLLMFHSFVMNVEILAAKDEPMVLLSTTIDETRRVNTFLVFGQSVDI